jgi:hypothetical protein
MLAVISDPSLDDFELEIEAHSVGFLNDVGCDRVR